MKGNSFYPGTKSLFWFFVLAFWILTLVGGCDCGPPFDQVSQSFSAFYFLYFIALTPSRQLWDSVLS